MSEEWVKLIAAAVVTLAQVYVVEPWKFPVFAQFWDWLARVTGVLANRLGWISVKARINYYSVVNSFD